MLGEGVLEAQTRAVQDGRADQWALGPERGRGAQGSDSMGDA